MFESALFFMTKRVITQDLQDAFSVSMTQAHEAPKRYITAQDTRACQRDVSVA